MGSKAQAWEKTGRSKDHDLGKGEMSVMVPLADTGHKSEQKKNIYTYQPEPPSSKKQRARSQLLKLNKFVLCVRLPRATTGTQATMCGGNGSARFKSSTTPGTTVMCNQATAHTCKEGSKAHS